MLFLSSVVGFSFAVFALWPANVEVGYEPEQPIAYSHRMHAGQLAPDYRRTNFEEVDDVYTPSEAVREASRCLRCYRIALAAH